MDANAKDFASNDYFSRKRNVAVAEYKQIKTRIAQNGLAKAKVELIPLKIISRLVDTLT